MTIAAEPLRHGREYLVPAMQAAVERLDEPIRTVTAYHLGWCDQHGNAVDANPGKAVRPGLALLAAEAVAGRPEPGLPGAVAVELVHNFSLVHDDLMDRDAERRHRPTVWSVWGDSMAVLAGDMMLSLAHEVLTEAESPYAATAGRVLAVATRDLIRGQAADIAFETRDPLSVSLDECFDMAMGKTGALLAVSGEVGAILAGAGEPVCAAFRTYGAELGIAFQLVDDLLGVWGEPERTGKPVFSDLGSRKKTMPIVWAMSRGGAEAEELAAWLVDRAGHDHDDLRHAADLLERTGARAWAIDEARARMQTALSALDDAGLSDTHREQLETLARFVIERDL